MRKQCFRGTCSFYVKTGECQYPSFYNPVKTPHYLISTWYEAVSRVKRVVPVTAR